MTDQETGLVERVESITIIIELMFVEENPKGFLKKKGGVGE